MTGCHQGSPCQTVYFEFPAQLWDTIEILPMSRKHATMYWHTVQTLCEAVQWLTTMRQWWMYSVQLLLFQHHPHRDSTRHLRGGAQGQAQYTLYIVLPQHNNIIRILCVVHMHHFQCIIRADLRYFLYTVKRHFNAGVWFMQIMRGHIWSDKFVSHYISLA